jgi:hypothetical protein
MSVFEFTNGCTVSREDDGTLTIEWDNGNALMAVTGASVDYVPEHMKMAGTIDEQSFKYSFSHDVHRMHSGGVALPLALTIALSRKTVMALPSARVNMAEVHVIDDDAETLNVDAAVFDKFVSQANSVKAIIQQAYTIFGINAITVLNKGHNYDPVDPVWKRLERATDLSGKFEEMEVAEWEGPLYHDAFHPFDLTWKIACVVAPTSPIIGHINGVLMTRLPGVPAGTAVVFAASAAIKELMTIRPQILEVLGPLAQTLAHLEDRIKAEPLDWCSAFPRALTHRNLSVLTPLEASIAFVYGMCEALFERKASFLKAASFKNIAGRNDARRKMGQQYAEALPEMIITDAQVLETIQESTTRTMTLFGSLGDIQEVQFDFTAGNVLEGDVADDEEEGGNAGAPAAGGGAGGAQAEEE